jgi:hypothetical protein
MPGHDVIVIGGSAGSLKPLPTLVGDLPPAFPATEHIILLTFYIRGP